MQSPFNEQRDDRDDRDDYEGWGDEPWEADELDYDEGWEDVEDFPHLSDHHDLDFRGDF
jgi:hypothetical protein